MSGGPVTYRYEDQSTSLVSARMIGLYPTHQDTIEPQESRVTCMICEFQKINVVLMPCGHKAFCNDCLRLAKSICPVCRKRFTNTVRID